MSLKQLIRQSPIVAEYLKRKRIIRWKKNGKPFPPPHDIKQLAVLHYGIAYGLETLVETGTFLGDMVWAQKDFFTRIYSIELSQELYDRAMERFSRFSHIRLLQGDSSEMMGQVVEDLSGPALFWLDGHYSGGITAKGRTNCPVYDELGHIFKSPFDHVILIDDARLFVGAEDYPSFGEFNEFVGKNSDYDLRTENDQFVLTKTLR